MLKLKGRSLKSFKDRETERFAESKRIAKWEPFRKQAEKRLRILEAATGLADLAALNSNRLETLKGDRKGRHSIRINQQWRICFECSKTPQARTT